jgi:hypothetical protein
MPCKTIDEVLQELDLIIANSLHENSFLGIFAYVYRRTTAQIKTGIENQFFEDNARLEKFDVLFANLFFDAYRKYRLNKPIPASWKIAFEAEHENLTIIQHILLGMNAHINLDLGNAAATVMEGQPIQALENDFTKVNDILAGLVGEMQSKLGKVSPLIFLLDWIGGRTEDKIIDFSMRKAREQSWMTANKLWNLDEVQKQEKINQVDLVVTALGWLIRHPVTVIVKYALRLIKLFEEKNLKRILEVFEESPEIIHPSSTFPVRIGL